MIAAAGTQQEQASIFLRFWTRKEAVLKAAGCGIIYGLNTFDVSKQSASSIRLPATSDEFAESDWAVRDLEQSDGFVGAVAAPPGNWSILQWPIRCENLIHRFAVKPPDAL